MTLFDFLIKEIGCDIKGLGTGKIVYCEHPLMENYERVFCLYNDSYFLLSAPAALLPLLKDSIGSRFPISENVINEVLGEKIEKVIGPAWIGELHCEDFRADTSFETKTIVTKSESGFQRFLNECDPQDIRNSSFSDLSLYTVGVYQGGRIVGAANCKILKDTVANIGVLVSPLFRGQGVSKVAISSISAELLKTNLLIQYQTIRDNISSVKSAQNVGFRFLAESLSFKLKKDFHENCVCF